MACPARINRRGRRIVLLIVVAAIFCAVLVAPHRLLASSSSFLGIPIRHPNGLATSSQKSSNNSPSNPGAASPQPSQHQEPPSIMSNLPSNIAAELAATSTMAPTADVGMIYDTTARPAIAGAGSTTLINDLPHDHIPSRTNRRRLIIVGDVHGMPQSLKKLLAKVKFNSSPDGPDHLILAGDLVNKGPDSRAVVQMAMDLGASAVRGNHEDRVLLARDSMIASFIDSGDRLSDPSFDTLEQKHFSHGDTEDKATARSLTPEQMTWLAARPVILRVGPVEGLDNVVVVHAGLVPGVPLERQDPWAVMNMRTIVYPREKLRLADAIRRVDEINNRLQKAAKDAAKAGKKTEAPSALPDKMKQELIRKIVDETIRPGDRDVMVPVDGRGGDPWATIWDKFEDRVASPKRTTVVFGHDAKTGLVQGKFTFGLDTACVRGGKLTALVITGGTNGVRHELVQVDCRDEARANGVKVGDEPSTKEDD